MQYRFIFNLNLCIGCRSCEIACRNEFAAKGGERWRWLFEIEANSIRDSQYLSLSCNHCESPECFRVCPERTYRKRRDGIVLHDPQRCSGCGNCVRACPFKVPRYSAATGKVDKCNMCVHRLDAGLLPACIQACHTGALGLLNCSQTDPPGSLTTVQGYGKVALTRPSTRFIGKQKPLIGEGGFFSG